MPKRGGMSPLSAALPLLQWVETHGRWPTRRECCVSQGLSDRTTYSRYFGVSTFSAVMEIATLIAEGGTPPLIQGRPPQRYAQTKPCLNAHCRRPIPDEGAHIRFCMNCRRKLNAAQHALDSTGLAPALPRTFARMVGAPWLWSEEELMEVTE